MTFDSGERRKLRRALSTMVDESPTAPGFDRVTASRTNPIIARRRPRFAFAAAALVVFVGVGAFMVLARAPNTSSGTDVGSFGPDELPRMLVDLPGWAVDRFDESSGDLDGGLGTYHRAETQYASAVGSAELRIEVSPVTTLDGLVADRLASGTAKTSQSVLGVEAAVIRYDGEVDDFAAVWAANGVAYEFRAALDETAFRTVLGSLRIVDGGARAAAMPSTVVARSERVDVVPAMLADVPIPPGVDVAAFAIGPSKDRCQLGVEVTGAVACGWIDEWISATATGDRSRIDVAAAAMQTSHEWAILLEMSEQGRYPQVVWEHADAIAGDGTIEAGGSMPVEASYRNALGCGSL